MEPGPRRPGSPYSKPLGFWLSDESSEDSWSAWCAAEEFPIGSHRTDFRADLSNVLHLSSDTDLMRFHDEYVVRIYPDWERVGTEYKGILITPYAWNLRLELDWYYGWDCASGCFWDLSCLTPVEARQAA